MSHTLIPPIRTNVTPSQRLAELLSMINREYDSSIEHQNCISLPLPISPTLYSRPFWTASQPLEISPFAGAPLNRSSESARSGSPRSLHPGSRGADHREVGGTRGQCLAATLPKVF